MTIKKLTEQKIQRTHVDGQSIFSLDDWNWRLGLDNDADSSEDQVWVVFNIFYLLIVVLYTVGSLYEAFKK